MPKPPVCDAVARDYGLTHEDLARRNDRHIARAVAAWLCRRQVESTRVELDELFGTSGPESVPNLTRRVDAVLKSRGPTTEALEEILCNLGLKMSDSTRPRRIRTTENNV